MSNFIKFKTAYFERIWGGHTFCNTFARKVSKSKFIGEAWDITDRADVQSVAQNGKFKGLTLHQIISENPEYIMGAGWEASRNFPIIVKWLDCSEILSLQVHPSKKSAKKYHTQTKNELWYFAKCSPKSLILLGLKERSTSKEFADSIKRGNTEKLLNKIKTHKGDVVFVPSGRVHSLGAGNLVLEIQQNSDTTYRVSDWGRVDKNGNARQLHVKQSLESIDFNDTNIDVIKTQKQKNIELCKTQDFSVVKTSLNKGEKICSHKGNARVLSVVDGRLKIGRSVVKLSQNILIPAEENIVAKATETTTLLLTEIYSTKK